MNAQPTTPNTAPDLVNIEIDGRALSVPRNTMIIQAADAAGIPIPRFCYHPKLPIAANCRMCMVETEVNGKPVPKPQPACATPVMEGMKVHTQSGRALSGQRNAMEFLLINHPLDCPVCDQGGECELQDLSLGYGRSVSRFTERKRVVADEDIGPLVATEMTRCIHCTRCVRVLGEMAGTYEFGDMDRGDRHVVGTYIGRPLVSELSGNVIDVCPVGALTNKVFQFKARPWELIARESIGYHDALGSNLWLHTRRGEVLRSVPRDNESINECWLSDRDRYSHQGLQAADRATQPMVRRNGELVPVTWDEAIAFVADGLKACGGDVGALVAPLVSCEEGFLLAQLLRALGSESIDHRLRTVDFADGAPVATFQMPVAQVEKASVIALIGCNPRHEMPLLAQRMRKAWKAGARIHAINPLDFDFNFELAGKTIAAPAALVDALLGVARAASDAGHAADAALAGQLPTATADDASRAMFKALSEADSGVVVFGAVAAMHPQASLLRAAARFVAQATGCAFNEIPAGANDVGLSRAGAQPHGQGRNAAALLAQPPGNLIIYQAGSQDTAAPIAFDAARSNAKFCVYMGAYACNGVKRTAHAVLPIGLPPESHGSYVNVDGIVQTLTPAARAPGEARPGWKVLRALGAALGVAGFEFTEYAEIRDALAARLRAPVAFSGGALATRELRNASATTLECIATVPIYRADQVLRRCPALQAHPLTGSACVTLNAQDALALGLSHDALARVGAEGVEVELPVRISRAVPKGAAWLPASWPQTRAIARMGVALRVTGAAS